MDVVIVVDDDSFGQSFPLAAGFLVGSLLTTNTTAHNGRFWTLCVCGVWAKETQVIYLFSLTERMRPGFFFFSFFSSVLDPSGWAECVIEFKSSEKLRGGSWCRLLSQLRPSFVLRSDSTLIKGGMTTESRRQLTTNDKRNGIEEELRYCTFTPNYLTQYAKRNKR
jgi:hypothetical protein